MTVREFIQEILIETPSLDAEVYISKPINDIESDSYIVDSISSEGSNDGIVINLIDYLY